MAVERVYTLELGRATIGLVEDAPAVYIEHYDSFIVADLHLGYEEALASEGVYLPRIQYRKAVGVLSKLAARKPGARLIIAGDVKHCFHRLTRQERVELAKLVRKAQELGFREIVLVRGNHDNYVATVLKPLGVPIVEGYLDIGKGVVVAHGHKSVEADYEVIVMGHEHPAIQVSVGGGRTKFPVYLVVPLEGGGEAVVLPPVGAYQVGNVVTTDRRNYLSPIIKEKGIVEDALPLIVDEEAGFMPLVRLGILEALMY